MTLTVDIVEWFEVDADRDGQVSYDDLDPAMPQVFDAVKRYFHVRGPALPLRTTLERYELQRDHVLQMRIVYTFDAPVTRLELASTIHQATSGDHQHIARVRLGSVPHDVVLGQQRTTAVFDVRNRPNTAALALGAVALAAYLWVRRGFLGRRR